MKRFSYLPVFALGLVFSLLGCASTATQEGTGEYFDDSVITTKVKAAIFNEPTLSSHQISVETFKGTVQLSGFVGSRAEVQKAGAIARDVKGVTSVKNDIKLKVSTNNLSPIAEVTV
jgi:osmotically-inducible protein OsmY